MSKISNGVFKAIITIKTRTCVSINRPDAHVRLLNTRYRVCVLCYLQLDWLCTRTRCDAAAPHSHLRIVLRFFVMCSAQERHFAAEYRRNMAENLEESFDIELFIGEIKNRSTEKKRGMD